MSELLKKYQQAVENGKLQTPFAKFNPSNAGNPARKYETISDAETNVKKTLNTSGDAVYTSKKLTVGPLSQPFVINDLDRKGNPTRIDTTFMRADSVILPTVSLIRDAQRVGRFLFGAVSEATKFASAIATGNVQALLNVDFRRGFLLTYYLGARASAYEKRNPNGATKGLGQIGRHMLGYIPDPFSSKDILDTVQGKRRGFTPDPFVYGGITPDVNFYPRFLLSGKTQTMLPLDKLKDKKFNNFYYTYVPKIGSIEPTARVFKLGQNTVSIFNNSNDFLLTYKTDGQGPSNWKRKMLLDGQLVETNDFSNPINRERYTSNTGISTNFYYTEQYVDDVYNIPNAETAKEIKNRKRLDNFTPSIRLIHFSDTGSYSASKNGNPIPFYFKLDTNDYLQFPNTIKSINEQVTATYEQTEYVNYNIVWQKYKSTSRVIDLVFTLHANNREEFKILYDKLNKLTGATFGVKKSNLLKPAIVFLTVGNLYKDQPVVINSLGKPLVTEQSTWDINEQLPNTIELTLNMNVLEKELPNQSSKFHN